MAGWLRACAREVTRTAAVPLAFTYPQWAAAQAPSIAGSAIANLWRSGSLIDLRDARSLLQGCSDVDPEARP